MSSAAVNGMAGAAGGIIAQIITYPLQTVNTRHQTERVSKSSILSGSRDNAGSTLDRMLQVIRNEGLGGLYSGLKPSLVGTAASQGIYYFFYQVFKNRAEAIAISNKKKRIGDGSPGILSWLVVAALAGSVNVLLSNPMWVLVTRMQTQTQAEKKILEGKREALLLKASSDTSLADQLHTFDLTKRRPYGTLQAACEIYQESGISGFWKGIIPTLIMVCNPSIQFMIYESLLKRLRTRRSAKGQTSGNVTAMEVFLVGAVAKLGATICTYPLLVVKSRLQPKQEIGENSSLRYSGTVDAIVKMIHYEGVASFYRGMSTKIVQSVFAASVLFMVKEEFVKLHATAAKGLNKTIK